MLLLSLINTKENTYTQENKVAAIMVAALIPGVMVMPCTELITEQIPYPPAIPKQFRLFRQ